MQSQILSLVETKQYNNKRYADKFLDKCVCADESTEIWINHKKKNRFILVLQSHSLHTYFLVILSE